MNRVKWTRITEDPSSYPEDGQRIVVSDRADMRAFVIYNRDDNGHRIEFYNWSWRPLYDFDTPPKD